VALKLKSAHDLAGIYRSGQIAGAFLRDVEQLIKPGVTTKQIDDFGAAFIGKHGATAAFLGYNGFPASLCISINEEIVHGIPGPRRLEAGDIVSIDVGVVLDGYVSDHPRTCSAC
jgi:methionyl aminopeptidase